MLEINKAVLQQTQIPKDFFRLITLQKHRHVFVGHNSSPWIECVLQVEWKVYKLSDGSKSRDLSQERQRRISSYFNRVMQKICNWTCVDVSKPK